MRLLQLLPIALLAVAACHEDGISVNERPPLGGVRFINAVADGGPVDIRMIDQVEWSANSVSGNAACCGLAFRSGTIHWATEAKPRHIRVFPSDSSAAIVSQILHDTTITIEADKNVTLMLVGSRAVGGKVSFIMIDDNPGTVPSNQIATRLVNASSTGQIPTTASAYITATTTTALPGTPTFAAVGPRSASPYLLRATGTFAFQATPAGDNATIWSAAAPAGAPADGLVGATAGATGGGSAFSAYLFPRSVAASPAPAAFTTPGLVYFVDLIPKPPL